ncbi:Scr1 family TA system antitoxin-like transcriptional regulator [Actinomadura flavalba]|uniref:Scr1 family TA system antitoxin-like transcriptional regulator n=1 Tax=Actinomadura flavalba TaxID=1120938 RepID=UPI00037DD2E6|nr:Scr1 family TA system antitoxin-like transcriptional regulator [Actinomadura flavalba]
MGDERFAEVGRELRRLRTAAGLSGTGLAARAGVPQPTVSRVETGRRISDPEVIGRLFGVLELDAGERERLSALVRDAYALGAGRRVDAGVSFRPEAVGELAREARTVRALATALIPAALRTTGYAAELGASAGGGPGDWGGVLDDPERAFSFVVAEAALRTWPGSGASMAGQLAHLLEMTERDNVRFQVLPGLAPLGRARVPLHGFTVFDESAVSVQTFTRELTMAEPDEVRAYLDVFAGMEAAAVDGDNARACVERAALDLRDTLASIHERIE